jgi:nucleotide-binding universal stress UspA family protein
MQSLAPNCGAREDSEDVRTNQTSLAVSRAASHAALSLFYPSCQPCIMSKNGDPVMSDLKWQRILAPTDHSAFAQKAVDYARGLAKQFTAELHVLRVMADADKAISEHAVTGVIDSTDENDEYHRWLKELVGETGDVRRIETVQIGTDVPAAILQYAKRNDIDLIVMATHGRTGLTHLVMGSVAEQVLRTAPCPVLTLRPEALK